MWIFAEERRWDGTARPRSRHTFAKWRREADDLAELEHDDRLGWHPLRRQFVTELKDVPLKDLCALGGWKSAATVLTCYMQPDEQTMRQALERRRAVPAGS